MMGRPGSMIVRWLAVVVGMAVSGCKNPDDGTKPYVFPAYPVRNLTAPKAEPPRPPEPRRLVPPDLPRPLSPRPSEGNAGARSRTTPMDRQAVAPRTPPTLLPSLNP